MLLEPEYLDRIYADWSVKDRQSREPNYVPHHWDSRRTYQREHRNGRKQQRFEDWLFSQGFTVIQRNGKRYLKFSGDESNLTWFLLKHGS